MTCNSVFFFFGLPLPLDVSPPLPSHSSGPLPLSSCLHPLLDLGTALPSRVSVDLSPHLPGCVHLLLELGRILPSRVCGRLPPSSGGSIGFSICDLPRLLASKDDFLPLPVSINSPSLLRVGTSPALARQRTTSAFFLTVDF